MDLSAIAMLVNAKTERDVLGLNPETFILPLDQPKEADSVTDVSNVFSSNPLSSFNFINSPDASTSQKPVHYPSQKSKYTIEPIPLSKQVKVDIKPIPQSTHVTIEPISEPVQVPTSVQIAVSTREPISAPTSEPISAPAQEPISAPTREPISAPTREPISVPTREPISVPTRKPISEPVQEPISAPTREPISAPTREPISVPTREPTSVPTRSPGTSREQPINNTRIMSLDQLREMRKNKVEISRINKSLIKSEIDNTNTQISENMTVWDVVKCQTPDSWESVFETAKDALWEVSKILEEKEATTGNWYPLKADIFNAFNSCRLDNVKVVIFGQDPYHGRSQSGYPQAVGMSFSVRSEDRIPLSLRNIYKEIARTHPDNTFASGDLTHWANQGVLMLNTCLTVDPGKAGSHGKIWEPFMNIILSAIAKANPSCVYVLWGTPAKKLATSLPSKGIIIEGYHPAARGSYSFVGCDHFVQIDEALEKQNKEKIDWSIP